MAPTSQRETLDDLYQTEGKAELISGRIVPLMPTGIRPNEIAANIYVSLRLYSQQNQQGRAFTDNVGYAIPELPSGRESFSPDALFYDGPLPTNLMRFVEGSPNVAVEVRSENDCGNAAETELATKRNDYFQAGTQVVWDVDSVNEIIYCYLASQPDQPGQFQRGHVANAEPAVPGWSVSVDEVFV